MDLDQVVAYAAGLPMTGPAVEAIADRVPSGKIRAAAESALELHDTDAAALIMLAGIFRGEAPDAKLSARVLPSMEHVDHALLLIGQSSGDRAGAILDACETDQLSSDREAALLLLATEILGDAPPPPVLKTRIRLLARRPLEVVSGLALGHAALAVADEDVEEVARRWVEFAREPGAEVLLESLRGYLTRRVGEVLPARPPEEIEGGYTIRRETPKVGRNQPCPCGSGKKFKRCCGRSGGSAPPPELCPRRRGSPYSRVMTLDQFAEIRAMDLRRLKPGAVAKHHLVSLLQRLTLFAFWEEAEAAADELETRGDLAIWAEGHRYDLFREALDAGREDVARRQMDLLPDDLIEDVDRLNIAVLADRSSLLREIEQMARRGLEAAETSILTELSYCLLERLPALGILVTRGALDPERSLDAWALLDAIEHARDRLLLPPGDNAWDFYERLLDIRDDSFAEQSVAQVNESLAQEIEDLRAQLSQEAEKSRGIKRRMEEALASIRRMREVAEVDPEPAPAPEPVDEDRTELLVSRVKELKTLLRESAYEKTRLRQKLSVSSRELARMAEKPAAVDEPVAGESLEPAEEIPADDTGRLSIRLPIWSDRFESSLRDLPEHVVRKALVTAGELGGAAPLVWSGVKRMKSAPRIRTARLGQSWRLLFEIDEGGDRLEMLEVLHRRDLDRALQSYR